MHNLSSNIIKLSNQITSILGFLAFLKLYNIAVIMFVLVNVNLIKVIVTIAHFFLEKIVLRFGGLTWLSASTSWFQNLSQKWVFSSPSQTNANLHKNLGPFRCVMSTFYNQITSWLTESGSAHFFIYFFTVEYLVSLRNTKHYVK